MFCTDRGVQSCRHRGVGNGGETGCVPGIARWLFFPFLPLGDNSAGASIGPLLPSILPGPERSSVEWSHPQPGTQSVTAMDLHCPQPCAAPDHSQQGPQTGHHWRLRKRKDHPQAGLKPHNPDTPTGSFSSLASRYVPSKISVVKTGLSEKSLRQPSADTQSQSHTAHNQQPTETLREQHRRHHQSSSSRKSNGINPSGYGGTICIDFSRSSVRRTKKEKEGLTPLGRDFFLAK